MGADRARGLLALKRKGARTVAQSEKTCVVCGMPRAAAELGAAERVEDLDRIAGFLMEASSLAERGSKHRKG